MGEINQMMQEFANESLQMKRSIDQVKEAISAIDIAVEESAKGITNVTELSVDLTTAVAGVGNEADSNMNIARSLNDEVNKFKLN